MKKFFLIYLFTVYLMPMTVNAAACSSFGTNRDGCLANGGCKFSEIDGCEDCVDNEYHPIQLNCTNPSSDNCSNTCASVGTGYFRNNDGTGQIQCPTITDRDLLSSSVEYEYIHNCIACTADTELIHTIQATTHIYYCGTCGYGITPTNESGNLKTCGCNTVNANHTYGTDPTNRQECICPTDSSGNDYFSRGIGGQPGSCMCGFENGGYRPQSSDNGLTFACCPGYSTYDSNKGGCVCNVQFAKITRDANNNKLTECECITGTIYTYTGDSCACANTQYVTFDNNTNPKVNWGETPQYLSSCTTCPQNSSPESYNYPRFCKCNASHYQDAPSSTSNLTPTCHKCPTQTQTPLPGSVGPESCRLKDTTHFSISNTHTRSMNLIPQGATILPIYTDPYVQNNNNAQSQYTH